MNIKAKLFFKGEERILLKTNVNYERFIAWNGKPTSSILDGTIKVSFESQMYDDMFIESLYEHRFGDGHPENLRYWQKLYKPHDGKIVFYEDDDYEIELFQYNFKDAVIIELYEEFDSENGMFITMVISPAMQDYRFFKGSTKWEEYSPTRYIKWAFEESYVKPRKGKTMISNKPQLLSYYFEDLNFNEIKEDTIKENQEIYLVIKSKNTKDLISEIDLQNKSIDYEYNGKWMKDDIIRNIILNDTLTKVKLKAIKPKK